MALIASPSTRIFCRYANVTFDPELANMTFRSGMLRVAWRQPGRYKIRSRQKRRARRLAALSSDSPRSYFGTGSDPKFAWTKVHLSPFFTKTRVDFARAGSFFPSLS